MKDWTDAQKVALVRRHLRAAVNATLTDEDILATGRTLGNAWHLQRFPSIVADLAVDMVSLPPSDLLVQR